MSDVLWLLPGTLCRRSVFAPVVRHLRPDVVVKTLNWAETRRLLAGRTGPPLNVAGFSLGGIAALGLLRRAPERIARLALIGSNAEAAGLRARTRAREQLRLLSRGGTQAMLAPALPSYFFRANDRRLRRTVAAMASRTRRGDARDQIALARTRTSSHAALRNFTGPLAVVAGCNDSLCPPDLQRRLLSSQPTAMVTFVHGCGHFVPLEAPAKLAAALRLWMRMPLTTPAPRI